MLVWAEENVATADNMAGVCPDKEAGGILLYAAGPCTLTFSIVNMTGSDLTVAGVPAPPVFTVNMVIKAYRSRTFQHRVRSGTQRWKGNLVIKPGIEGNMYQFAVAFQASTGMNGRYPGTWIYLPVPPSGPYLKTGSSSTGQTIYGRWSTNVPVGGDRKMHNIMTIVSDKVIASLYSVDNQHMTLLVSDTLKDYTGKALDWVWNDGIYVPAGCAF